MAKKLYYKIGEACKLLGIQPYVLRFWETEFPFLKPTKSKSGQRVYQEPQLNLIRRIKELLYEEEYTIAGAKKKLESEISAGKWEAIQEVEDGVQKRTTTRKPTPKQTTSKKSTEETPASTKADKGNGSAATAAKKPEEHALQLATLRKGVQEAIDQCQQILRLLEA